MNRTQIYLNDTEKKALDILCENTTYTKSSFIREALDFYLSYKNISYLNNTFDKSYGCLKPQKNVNRHEWDEREKRFF